MFYNFILHDNIELYKTLLKRVKKTIYHDVNYLLAEEKAESYPIYIFVLEESDNIVLFPSIIRKVNDLTCFRDLDNIYCDMITPHEYSGPLTDLNGTDILKKFYCELEFYCHKHNIIYQFLRLNPYLDSCLCKDYIDVQLSCQQVYIDLEVSCEMLWSDYSSVTRRNIKRSEKHDLKFRELDSTNENILRFMYLYQDAMDYLKARKFFYFNETYFDSLLKNCDSKLFEVYSNKKDMIASGIVLLDDKVVYYHLGAFDRNYSLSRPMNYLIHSMILWCKNNNYTIFHLGGGGKSLFHFKSGFSKKRIDYFIGTKIYSEYIYNKLCTLWKSNYPQFSGIKFMPQYRANE